jgi:hypothetical protein
LGARGKELGHCLKKIGMCGRGFRTPVKNFGIRSKFHRFLLKLFYSKNPKIAGRGKAIAEASNAKPVNYMGERKELPEKARL